MACKAGVILINQVIYGTTNFSGDGKSPFPKVTLNYSNVYAVYTVIAGFLSITSILITSSTATVQKTKQTAIFEIVLTVLTLRV